MIAAYQPRSQGLWSLILPPPGGVRWIMIYPADSVIQPLNKWSQIYKLSLALTLLRHNLLHIALIYK